MFTEIEVDSPTKNQTATHVTHDSVMSEVTYKNAINKKDKQQSNMQRLQLESMRIARVKGLLAIPPDQTKDIGANANPMLGHSDKVIFTRITGHPDLLEQDQWFDSSECWICNRHNKFSFRVANCHELQDKEFMEIISIGWITKELEKKRV